MKPNKRGFYEEEDVFSSLLPIVDFDKDPDCYCNTTWFTYTDLKNILEITLTQEERENSIAAFQKMSNGHGYTPLYSFLDILDNRTGGKRV